MIFRKYPWLRTVLLVALILVVLGLSVANMRFVRQTTAASDFLPFWSASRAWLTDGLSPYSTDVQDDADALVYGRDARPSLGERSFMFLYPYPSVYLALPFGLLEYATARAVWMTLLEIALPVVVVLAFAIFPHSIPPLLLAATMALSLLWFPGFVTIINGQMAVLVVAALAGALLAIRRDADVWAGILLSLVTLKPQLGAVLLLFLVVWGIRRRRWKIILALVGGVVVLWGGAFLFESAWLLAWGRTLVRAVNLGLNTSPAVFLIASLVPSAEEVLGIAFLVIAVLSLVWEWGLLLVSDDRMLSWTVAYTACMTVFLIPPLQYGDHTILLIPLATAVYYAYDRWKGGSLRLMALLLSVLVVVSWLPFLNSEVSDAPGLLSLLPPVLLVIALRWSRWWARHALDWWDGDSSL